MRIALADGLGTGQAELAEELHRARFGLAAIGGAVLQGGFHHLVHEPVSRIKGGRRRLCDVADFAAA